MMFKLFKNKTTNEEQKSHHQAEPQPYEQTDPAPGTEIRYRPTLIDELKSDHQTLLGQYVAIKAAFDKSDYASVSELLNDFRFNLHNHLLTENVRLYIYIGRMMEHDHANSGMIRSFRQEMEGIGKTAIRLLKKYEAISIDNELAAPFANDFAAIGAILTERVKKEESVLYPLYKAAY